MVQAQLEEIGGQFEEAERKLTRARLRESELQSALRVAEDTATAVASAAATSTPTIQDLQQAAQLEGELRAVHMQLAEEKRQAEARSVWLQQVGADRVAADGATWCAVLL